VDQGVMLVHSFSASHAWFDESPVASMSVIDDAEKIINKWLGYLASEAREVDSQIAFNQQRQDAISKVLVNIADANMARKAAAFLVLFTD
jgi:flagellin-like hook-associated protein FlgL